MKTLLIVATLIFCAFALAFAQDLPKPLPLTACQVLPVNDISILNYALTLEHLEYAFYRDALKRFNESQVVNKNFTSQDYEYLTQIRDHEKIHVDTLISVITSLGGTPVLECKYDFNYTTFDTFLTTAALLENTGVSAYTGAIGSIKSTDLVTASATIATIEARHAAYLNLLTGQNPFPQAFDTPLNRSTILSAAGGFIVSCPAANSRCFGINGTNGNVCNGNGTCDGPNLCICDPGFSGPFCNCTVDCGSEGEVCSDLNRGTVCYSPATHQCINNTVLCSVDDDACGIICFDPVLYNCQNGTLELLDNAVDQKKLGANSANSCAASLVFLVVYALIAMVVM